MSPRRNVKDLRRFGIKGRLQSNPLRADGRPAHQRSTILGGEPIFRGRRVPFRVLIDDWERGHTLDHFLEEYPSVGRELAIAATEEARLRLVAQLK